MSLTSSGVNLVKVTETGFISDSSRAHFGIDSELDSFCSEFVGPGFGDEGATLG
jgi:hypothetical protein